MPIAGVERVALIEPAHAVERQLDVARQAGHDGEVGNERRVRTEVEHGVEVPDVVVVVVRDEDPSDVDRIDDRERLVQPRVAHERATGVDDDGLFTADDERVRSEERSRGLGSERRDQPGVGGDEMGVGVERDRDHDVSF